MKWLSILRLLLICSKLLFSIPYVQFNEINQSKYYDPLHLPNLRKVSSKDMSSARDLFFSGMEKEDCNVIDGDRHWEKKVLHRNCWGLNTIIGEQIMMCHIWSYISSLFNFLPSLSFHNPVSLSVTWESCWLYIKTFCWEVFVDRLLSLII